VKTVISPHLGHLKLPMEGRKHIYMLCKEAVNNAVKYSQGTEILFEVTSSGNILQLIVADNGKGFDIEHIKPGLGLESMYQRSRELGGKLTIHSSHGMGTSVCLVCKIPH
jgi:signal transduction histidine kinase